MNTNRFSIENIKLGQLYQYARSSLSDLRFADVSPISLIRALAQSKNPHADPDDISLVVGYENNRCVGYHGLLPGFLSAEAGLSKVYWLVTFFLMPACRGKGYGKQLVREIQKSGADLVTTGITDAAEKVYRSVGFRTLGELEYYRINFDGAQETVPGFEMHRRWQGIKERQRDYKAREVSTVGKLAGKQSDRPHVVPAFQRDLEVQNWMLHYPWVVSGSQAQSDVKNYYFSRIRDRFEFIGIEFYAPDEKPARGYMILSVSSRKDKTVLKTLDVFFKESEDTAVAAYTALKYALANQAQRLEFPACLNHFYLAQPLLQGLTKKKKRLYLYYPGYADSPLAQSAPEIELSYCDGDTAFT